VKTTFFVALFTLGLVISCGGSAELTRSPLNDTSAVPDVSSAAESRIVITSAIDLEIDGVATAYTDVGALARSYGGYVAEARTGAGDGDSAFLRLRVPAARHDDLVGSLRTLTGAKVLREGTNAKEVSEEYTDLQSRLRNLQASEAQYLDLLRRAESINDILQINTRLDGVRQQIEQVQGRLNLLTNLSDFATVNVNLTAPPARLGTSSPLEVLQGAVETSLVVAAFALNFALVLAVAAAWLLPTGVAALIAWRLSRRQLRSVWTRLVSW
jgi:hypothetical protein